jgi:hypothetical protein
MKTFKVMYLDEKNLTKYCYIQARDSGEAAKLFKQQYPNYRFYNATEVK